MFASLDLLRLKPIPDLTSLRSLNKPLTPWPIDRDGAAAREPLTAVASHGLRGRNYYAHTRNPPYWHAAPGAIDALVARAGVCARLAAVDARLAEAGLALYLFDAWRPRAVQAYFHDVWTPALLRGKHPDWSEDAVRAAVGRYWAAPTQDPDRPAPHETGAAIDLTIVWRDDDSPLWMGALFDDPSSVSAPDHYEGAGAVSVSDEEARANRRLLHWVMTEAGFCPHPNEWWHFSYGDQYWAHVMNHPAALYGLAEPELAS